MANSSGNCNTGLMNSPKLPPENGSWLVKKFRESPMRIELHSHRFAEATFSKQSFCENLRLQASELGIAVQCHIHVIKA